MQVFTTISVQCQDDSTGSQLMEQSEQNDKERFLYLYALAPKSQPNKKLLLLERTNQTTYTLVSNISNIWITEPCDTFFIDLLCCITFPSFYFPRLGFFHVGNTFLLNIIVIRGNSTATNPLKPFLYQE